MQSFALYILIKFKLCYLGERNRNETVYLSPSIVGLIQAILTDHLQNIDKRNQKSKFKYKKLFTVFACKIYANSISILI